MTDRMLLLLPEGVITKRGNRGGRGNNPLRLAAGRQQERLGPRLKELEAAFEARRVQLQTAASGIVPEDVLVLETATTIEEFRKAVFRIEGLEFLGEYDKDDIPPDDDFFVMKDNVRVGYTGRVYMIFSNQEAFRQLLRLWQMWQKGGKFEIGLTKWREVFSLLRDIRPWGVKDRLEETGVLDDWAERVERGEERVPCEIELWFRSTAEQRAAASRRIRHLVEGLEGEVLAEGVVEGIHYHAIVARLPLAAVHKLLDERTRGDVQFIQSEQIQFVRASGQMIGKAAGERLESRRGFDGPLPTGAPVVAILDGLPLQKHRAIDGRVTIDDPDNFEMDYRADARKHGTAMTSLIIWGDLNTSRRVPIPQPLYVRPIMHPVFPPEGWKDAEPFEQVPEGVLVVDLVYRAVRRMFEGDGSEPPAAGSIVVVNLSIGIRDRPFESTVSPLARLLDWLAWKYQVLFIVSAGNHLHAIEMGRPWSELSSMGPADLAVEFVRAVAADSRHRRVLSPAEGMNVLTVGALHTDEDSATLRAGMRLDPLPLGYPSPINGHGLGYRRSVKPEVLVPGGRIQVEQPLRSQDTRLRFVRFAAAPGQEVAAPGPTAGDLGFTTKIRGTSNAAAILSRSAAFFKPVIDELRSRDGGATLNDVSDAVLVKTLLVHGARWGHIGARYRDLFKTSDNDSKLLEQLARLLGFGPIEMTNLSECTATRVTVVGGGSIKRDLGVEHRFPLPPSLSGKHGLKRLTVTLAWFTPVNPLNHRWRKAHLWFETPKSKLRNVLTRAGVDRQAAQRGTVQHETFEGEKAAAFVDGDDIIILVSCREDAKGLTEVVPYGLAVTLEVADGLGIDVYIEVSERIRARQRVAPRVI